MSTYLPRKQYPESFIHNIHLWVCVWFAYDLVNTFRTPPRAMEIDVQVGAQNLQFIGYRENLSPTLGVCF